jgi:hypothetical protein
VLLGFEGLNFVGVLMEEDDDDSEASDLDDHTDEIDGPPLVVIGAPTIHRRRGVVSFAEWEKRLRRVAWV